MAQIHNLLLSGFSLSDEILKKHSPGLFPLRLLHPIEQQLSGILATQKQQTQSECMTIMGGGQRKVFFALQGGVPLGTWRHVKTMNNYGATCFDFFTKRLLINNMCTICACCEPLQRPGHHSYQRYTTKNVFFTHFWSITPCAMLSGDRELTRAQNLKS